MFQQMSDIRRILFTAGKKMFCTESQTMIMRVDETQCESLSSCLSVAVAVNNNTGDLLQATEGKKRSFE